MLAVTAGASVLLVLVAGIAPAAPSTKVYQATVGVAESNSSAKLKLTLTNDPKSKQTLGSANFTAPAGVVPTSIASASGSSGWTVDGSVVKFRSAASGLAAGSTASAEVNVTITPGTSAGQCSDATWSTQVKQSNDFSGSGNDFAINAALSNLRPLGAFAVDPIETVVPAEPDDLQVPQILISQTAPVRVTAYDVCGASYVDYGSGYGNVASLAAVPDTPSRLQGATITSITWSRTTAVGTASVTPVVVETGDQLRVTDVIDGTTSITGDSNVFDVVEKLCTALDTNCQWQGKQGKITVNSVAPPSGSPSNPPSLGIGFYEGDLGYTCGTPLGDTLININPRDYPQDTAPTIIVTLTYDKSLSGNGPASGFQICLLKDYGETWTSVTACPSSSPAPTYAPCFLDRKRVNGGALQVVLFLKSQDPWGGVT